MSITNNYNTEPYYDDFNPEDDKNFHRILFRPGVSVQARELTQLQTLLQNQIARHGEHFFKEGSPVTGAEFGFTNNADAVKLNGTNGTLSVDSYSEQLLDVVVVGSKSGVEARIVHVEDATAVDPLTIYVNYLTSGYDGSTSIFKDDESLLWKRTEEDIAASITEISGISEGRPLAVTAPTNATAKGATASIESGIIFVKGCYVHIPRQRVVLSKYSPNPTARLGIDVIESTITADEDQSLLDTALNAPNYSARGADRYLIELKLVGREITDNTTQNFVELQRIVEGKQQAKAKISDYDVFADEQARRTYEQFGDYTIKPYELELKEQLNTGTNQGVYSAGTTTDDGNLASEDSMTLQISSGKSYVKGYELETTTPSYLDVPKPRTFLSETDATSVIQVGNYVRLTNTHGMPETVGDANIEEYELIELKDTGIGNSVYNPGGVGETIGLARARDFTTQSSVDVDSDGTFDQSDASGLGTHACYLFDIKMLTHIDLVGSNAAESINAANNRFAVELGSLITGEISGATGYYYGTTSNGISLTSVAGTFLNNERLTSSNSFRAGGFIHESVDDTNQFTVASVKTFAFEEVKALRQDDTLQEFKGDVVLDNVFTLTGTVQFTDNNAGTANRGLLGLGTKFSEELRVGDAIRLPTGTSLGGGTASETRFVTAVFSGESGNTRVDLNAAPTTVISGAFTARRLRGGLKDQEKNLMLRMLDKPYIKTLKTEVNDFESQNQVTVSRQFQGTTVSGVLTLSAIGNETFKAKSNQNYSVTIMSHGATPQIWSSGAHVDIERLTFSGEGTGSLTITGFTNDDTNDPFEDGSIIRVNTTLQKQSQNEKTKSLQRASLLRVENKSEETQGYIPYGTSAHHKDISLGVADIFKVLAVYDSGTVGQLASSPSLSLTNPQGAFITTETIVGSQSGAIAILLQIDGNNLSYTPLNSLPFISEEEIVGQTSSASGSVGTLTAGDNDILNSFTYDPGQRDNYYDIGKLILKKNERSPQGELLVVFDYFTHGFGDFFTVDSYSDVAYKDIPAYVSTRVDPESPAPTGIFDLRSTVDFRPRVADAPSGSSSDGVKTVTGTSFNINSRSFSSDGNSGASSVNTVRDNSNFDFDYEYYLARKDSLYLTTQGEFVLIQGNDSEDPKYPDTIDNAMRLADLSMPPYVIDVRDVAVEKFANKRFTMRDLSTLEKRVNNIEYYTSLSLLEVSADTLQIKDENGLDRFKSGFLVDNFGGHKTGDVLHPDYRCAIDMYKRILRPKYAMKNIALVEKYEFGEDKLAHGYTVTEGGLAMLPYEHVKTIEQNYASTIENLNPVLNFAWTGQMTLSPSSDEWFEIERLPDVTVNKEGNFDTLIAQNADALGTVWDAATTNWTGITTTDLVGPRIRENTGNFRADFVRGFGRRVLQQQQETEVGVLTRNGIETNIVEQIDVTSNGDKVVGSALIPFMRQKNIKFEARGLRPHTQVYPFFDNVEVSKYCTTSSGGITPVAGKPATVPQVTNAAWNSVKRILISFDKNSNDITKFSVLAGNQTRRLGDGDPIVDTVLEGEETHAGLQYRRLEANTSARNTKDRDVIEFIFDDNALIEPSDNGDLYFTFYVRNIADDPTTKKTYPDPYPKRPTLAGKTFYKKKPMRAMQISEVQFFNENFSLSPDLNSGVGPGGGGNHTNAESWNLYNSLISNIEYAEIIEHSFIRTPEAIVDGGAMLDGYLIDGINYRSDQNLYSEGRVDANARIARWTVRLRGGARQIENPDSIERFVRTEDVDTKALVTDASGFVSGTFTIPDSKISGNPAFRTGSRLFRLTSSSSNAKETVDTFAQEKYTATGTLNSMQETFTATRNGRVETRSVQENVEVSRSRDLGLVQVGWYDPLAQSIMPSVPGGEFITKVDVFFAGKDDHAPVTLQLREMENGLPTRKVLPSASITLDPSDVNVSQVGTAATSFEFPNPVYVKANQEICIVLMTDSIGYTTWISKLGDTDIDGVRNIDEQPYLGVLFKSQNNSTWTAYDYEDLKFTVYRAEFDTSQEGVITLENEDVPLKQLRNNPLICSSGSSIIKVLHPNHHMYYNTGNYTNKVRIEGASSGITANLKSDITSSATTMIIKDLHSSMPTSGDHYFKLVSNNKDEIENEIIYGTIAATGTSGEYSITVSSATQDRGINSPISFHSGEDGSFQTTTVELYESNGISLVNVNRVHEIHGYGLDHYTIDISSDSLDSANSPSVTAVQDSAIGSSYVTATENALVDAYQLMLPVVTYPETNIDTRIKFATGTSVSGNQIPFVAGQYSKTELIERTEFKEPKIIASSVNESGEILGGNKSAEVELTLSTKTSTLSPIVDLERKSITAYANRIDYISEESDVDSSTTFIPATAPEGDSSESVYITKRVQLKNPATSIKVILDAVVNAGSDLEVMYKVLRSDDSSDFDELGWNYFNTHGETDIEMSKSVNRTSFKEHEYTQDNIPEFISFSIKIKMKGINSSQPPLVKDLRAIALAL
jgi:hypothetical protein